MLYGLIGILYRILGSKLSSQLITTPLGKLVFLLMFKHKGLRSYQTKEHILLRLYPVEALSFGIGLLGTYNEFETNIVKRRLKSGAVVIDIGAFLGWYSIIAARIVGSLGKVYAFEPNPKQVERLKESLFLNQAQQVHIVEAAASDKNGSALFYDAESGSSLIKNEAEGHIGYKIKGFKVKTMTLDTFVKQRGIRKVDFIKIDAEGADYLVLKGAAALLQKQTAPDLMVEVIDKELIRAGASSSEVIEYLKGFGYTPYDFTSDGLRRYTGKITTANLFFTKSIRRQ